MYFLSLGSVKRVRKGDSCIPGAVEGKGSWGIARARFGASVVGLLRAHMNMVLGPPWNCGRKPKWDCFFLIKQQLKWLEG